MSGSRAYDRRPPARWRRAVCVLGLLAGVLAMHGLAPGGTTGQDHTAAHARSGGHGQADGHAQSGTDARSGGHAGSGGHSQSAAHGRSGAHAGSGGHAQSAAHSGSGGHSRGGALSGFDGADRGHHVDAVAVTAPALGCPDGGGHARHADPTCASGAVGGGPVLPAPVPDPVPAAVRADAVRAYAAQAPDGAPASPSLAELQLLRI